MLVSDILTARSVPMPILTAPILTRNVSGKRAHARLERTQQRNPTLTREECWILCVAAEAEKTLARNHVPQDCGSCPFGRSSAAAPAPPSTADVAALLALAPVAPAVDAGTQSSVSDAAKDTAKDPAKDSDKD